MFNLGSVKTALVHFAGATGLILKRHGPEILTGTGIVGVVVGAVFACNATLKVQDVLDEAKEKMDNIKLSREHVPDKYSEEDKQKDIAITYTKTAVAICKLYAPAVGIGILSIACILGGHTILRKENAAIAAAYVSLAESYREYRKRVTNDAGEDKDKEYMYGIKKEEVETTDEKGEAVKKTVNTSTGTSISPYARYFCEGGAEFRNPNYSESPQLNMMFLNRTQDEANDILHSRGYIFLNEVYEMIGIPQAQLLPEGQVLGWALDLGDTKVDFGIHNVKCNNMNSVNGLSPVFLLDFNVDTCPITGIFDKKTDMRKFQEKLSDPNS